MKNINADQIERISQDILEIARALDILAITCGNNDLDKKRDHIISIFRGKFIELVKKLLFLRNEYPYFFKKNKYIKWNRIKNSGIKIQYEDYWALYYNIAWNVVNKDLVHL